jgi:hypothetical protein
MDPVIVSARAVVPTDKPAVSATSATFVGNVLLVFILMCFWGFDVVIVVTNLLGVI